MATVGYERLEEQADPEKTIEVRKELTDEWESRGVKTGSDFAMLTNILNYVIISHRFTLAQASSIVVDNQCMAVKNVGKNISR